MSTLADPTSKQRIYDLLDDLPPEGLEAVEGFVRFLHEQVKKARTNLPSVADQPALFQHPTVSLPLTTLGSLVGLLPPVGGDALAETEALYDIESQA